MAFQQPNFNLLMSIWDFSSDVHFNPPRLTNVPANLSWGKRVGTMSTGGTASVGIIVHTMTLLVPAATDLRGRNTTPGPDKLEIPQGSGRFYITESVDFIGLGFANEHKGAVIMQFNPFKVPDVF